MCITFSSQNTYIYMILMNLNLHVLKIDLLSFGVARVVSQMSVHEYLHVLHLFFQKYYLFTFVWFGQ